MKYLKTFESISDDKMDKIESLSSPGYYINSKEAGLIKSTKLKNLDIVKALESRIKDIFIGYEFSIEKNIYGKDVFRILDDDLEIRITEIHDEYFYVVVNNVKSRSKNSISYLSGVAFVADQTDGLIYLLTDIQKIINEK
jgi:hypothetical protein